MIPFFKLPLFPLLDIVQNWTLKEIILFSMTSSRSSRAMRNLLKYHGYSNQITVEMDVSPTFHSITVYSETEQCAVSIVNKSWLRKERKNSQQTFNSLQYLLVESNEYNINTYWQNENLAINIFYAFFRDLFEKPITILYYTPSKGKLCFELLKTIFNDQKTIENCSIGALDPLEKDTIRALELFENAQNLSLNYPLLDYDLSKFKFQNVVIEDGELVPFQKLTELNFESLELYQHSLFGDSLQDEQLNSILRLWVTGFLPRMKKFYLETHEYLRLPKILKTIDFEPSENRIEFDEEDTVLTGGPLNIKRLTDGRTATVYTMNFWNENGQQMTFLEFSVNN
ncbi:unnamed protein product [Caenorhabditis brenneri]